MDITQFEGIALFEGLSDEQLRLVAEHAIALDVPRGKEVVHDAAQSWDFFVITRGSADVRRGDSTVGTLGPGDHFGEIGVFATDRLRTAAVVTTSPLHAIVMSAHQLRTVAKQVPELGARLQRSIDRRLAADEQLPHE